MKIFLIFISLIFFVNPNIIHQDTPLKIDKKGNVIGLPKKFCPAKFDLDKKVLKIRSKKITFPKCLNCYFEKTKNPKLNLSASWYYSKDVMPYYLSFNISDKNSKNTYSVLVDLETLELIGVDKSFMEGNSYFSSKIDLDKNCLIEYKKAIRNLNK